MNASDTARDFQISRDKCFPCEREWGNEFGAIIPVKRRRWGENARERMHGATMTEEEEEKGARGEAGGNMGWEW